MSFDNYEQNSLCGCNSALFTVISGSFRKHLLQISLLKKELEDHHIKVLSPIGNAAINPNEEFIILETDHFKNPKLLQDSVFAKIRRSSFLVVANIENYLGNASILEIGYAISTGIDIYTLEPIKDPNISPYCQPIQKIFHNIDFSNFSKNHSVNSLKDPRIAKYQN